MAYRAIQSQWTPQLEKFEEKIEEMEESMVVTDLTTVELYEGDYSLRNSISESFFKKNQPFFPPTFPSSPSNSEPYSLENIRIMFDSMCFSNEEMDYIH